MRTKRERQQAALERRKVELAYWQNEQSPQVRRLMQDFSNFKDLHLSKINKAEKDIQNLQKKLGLGGTP